jgi:hypothetical protein
MKPKGTLPSSCGDFFCVIVEVFDKLFNLIDLSINISNDKNITMTCRISALMLQLLFENHQC